MSCSTGQKTFNGIITRELSKTLGYLTLQSSLRPRPLGLGLTEVGLELIGTDDASIIDSTC